jgi:hypothetical protein
MPQMTFPESIRAYKDECEAVASWLKDGWLDQDEFDAKSTEFIRADRMASVHQITEGTVVPPIWGGVTLAVLHEMQAAGMVEARQRDGRIEYRLSK